ncbi:hypothetical protein BDV93DRAFT_544423, partial [Ceratobasidium sp. AG-I]
MLFSRLVELVDAVGDGGNSIELFERWSLAVSKDLGPALFRLLFPEHDVARRFPPESRLANLLARILRTPSLRGYKTSGDGCLGSAVADALAARPDPRAPGPTLGHIDKLLSELAALSPWSHHLIRREANRTEAEIISELYSHCTPRSAALVTQIILKSIHPLLYPSPCGSTTSALLDHVSPARSELTIWDAMRAWDSRMPRIYRVRADLAIAAQTLLNTTGAAAFEPLINVPIEIPKCHKARSVKDSLDVLVSSGAPKAFAEVKYDGERMQIHIDLSKPSHRQITIFSKSKRDSTLDRAGTHPVIRAALGLPQPSETQGIQPAPPLLLQRIMGEEDNSQHAHETILATGAKTRTVRRSVILEGEMVAYDESRGEIDEFWRVRGLVESTAIGVRARKPVNRFEEPQAESFDSNSTSSQNTLHSQPNSSTHTTHPVPKRHLALIFFDVLALDGQSLLNTPFERRREILEELIRRIPGWSGISTGEWIDLNHDSEDSSQSQSQSQSQDTPSRKPKLNPRQSIITTFSRAIASYQEGLVLKPSTGAYNSTQARWVKMKKDYIPGLGDCADFVVLGAGWDRDRGRELGVRPNVWTTFYVGVRTNEDDLGARPAFDIAFTVSYGLSRAQLEELNHRIESTSAYETYRPEGRYMRISYDMSLVTSLRARPPRILFRTPLLFELMGAGFTKSESSRHYELRFPRITKVHSPTDRAWTSGLGARSLQRLAREAIGLSTSGGGDSAEEVVDRIWGDDEDVSGGGGGGGTREERAEKWARALGGHRIKQKPESALVRKAAEKQDPARESPAGKASESVVYLDEMLGEEDAKSDIGSGVGDEDGLEGSDVGPRMDILESEAGVGKVRKRDEDTLENQEKVDSWKRRRLDASKSSPTHDKPRNPLTLVGNLSADFSPPGGNDTVEVVRISSAILDVPPKDSASAPPALINRPTAERSSSSILSQALFASLNISGPPKSSQLPDRRGLLKNPALLLADAFIYIAHRSAPRPSSLVLSTRRVFSPDALLAGLDWTGVKRKRRALDAHTSTNQEGSASKTLRGVVIVDRELEDFQMVVEWAKSLGTVVRHSWVDERVRTALYVVAPRTMYSYSSDYSMDGLGMDVLCVVLPPS